MEGRKGIGQRIKKLRKKQKFSQVYVAEQLFISQSAYSLIESSQNGIVAEHIIKLSKLYDVTTDFILKGEVNLIKLSAANGFVPFVKVAAHAGFIKNYGKELSIEDYEFYRIPGFNPAWDLKLFEVEGESMVPTVLPGDVVICQTQKNIDNLLDGSLVLVITEKAILVKRIKLDPDSQFLTLENDNPNDHEIMKLHKSNVVEIMIVRGKIGSTLIPHHQLASKGKIQSLEESIELLKKELYAMTKKINSLLQKQ